MINALIFVGIDGFCIFSDVESSDSNIIKVGLFEFTYSQNWNGGTQISPKVGVQSNVEFKQSRSRNPMDQYLVQSIS